MSTKLRVVLNYSTGVIYFGTVAVQMVLSSVNVMHIPQMPWDWGNMSMNRKLQFLAGYMPAGSELTLIRERSKTRKNKSLYLKTIGPNSIRNKKQAFGWNVPRQPEVFMDYEVNERDLRIRERAAQLAQAQAQDPQPEPPEGFQALINQQVNQHRQRVQVVRARARGLFGRVPRRAPQPRNGGNR